jgi:sugar (pentulose or hexulose) kinase
VLAVDLGTSGPKVALVGEDGGIAAHTAGNIEEAKKQYNECLKHEITHKVCHYNLGLIAQTAIA